MERPLIYYSIALFIGGLNCLVCTESFIIGAVLTASFLLILFLTVDKKFFFITVIFFFVGTINYFMYFNLNMPKERSIEVRVKEKYPFSCIATYNNKKIILKGNINSFYEGEKIKIQGDFKKEIEYDRGILGTYYVEKYSRGHKDIFLKMVQVKNQLHKQFLKILGEEKTAVIMGVCYGDSKYFTKEQKEDFKNLGIAHVVSVSGLHMAIVYGTLEKVIGFKFSLITSFIYMIFTGSKVATIRSFIMIFILKLSKKIHKNYDGLSSIAFSAMIILLLYPQSICDIGFMLSFLCVLGITLYNKKLKKKLYRLPKKINESISMSISSQVLAIPYMVIMLNNLNLGSVLSNLILLPIYDLIVVLGNLGILVFKFSSLFKLLSYGLLTILTALEGAQRILTEMLPLPITVTYVDGIVILGMYICYIGVKKGYKELKYAPVILVLMILFQNYRITPEIQYINLGKNNNVIIKYKFSSILVCKNNVKLKEIREPLSFKEIIMDSEEDVILKLGKKYIIKIPKNMELQVFSEKKKYLFTDKNESNNYQASYDIIKVPKYSKKYSDKGRIVASYRLIKNRVLEY